MNLTRLEKLKAEKEIIQNMKCLSFDLREKCIEWYDKEIECIEKDESSAEDEKVTLEETAEHFKKMVNGFGIYGLSTSRPKDAEMIEIALYALDAQIPKKPVRGTWENKECWYCPSCGEIVVEKQKNEYSNNCCGSCGQALDWGEEE